MSSNNTMSQSAPISIDLSTFKGRGVQPRTMFADEVTGHLVNITYRTGEYEVMRNGKPVIDPETGETMKRPNSAIAEWRDDAGNRVLTNWPCRYVKNPDGSKSIVPWDAFDETINLAIDHLHFEKEVQGNRTFYSLTRVEVQQVQQQAVPRAQAFVQPTMVNVAPWDYEG